MSGYSSVNGKNLQNHSLTVNKMQNNPFLVNNGGSNSGNNVFSSMASTINSSTSPSSSSSTNTSAIITTIAGSPGRARDRNVFMQPTNIAPMQLSLLKGYLYCEMLLYCWFYFSFPLKKNFEKDLRFSFIITSIKML